MPELPGRPDLDQLRRRSSGPGASPPVQDGGGRGSLDAPEEGWSFGGGTAIETAEGVLAPGALFIRSGHAFLDATLTLSAKVERDPKFFAARGRL